MNRNFTPITSRTTQLISFPDPIKSILSRETKSPYVSTLSAPTLVERYKGQRGKEKEAAIGKAVRTARNFPVTLPFVWIPNLTQLDFSPPRRRPWCDGERGHSRKWRWLEVRVANVTFCWVNFIESSGPSGSTGKEGVRGEKKTVIHISRSSARRKRKATVTRVVSDQRPHQGKILRKGRYICACVYVWVCMGWIPLEKVFFKVKHRVVWIFHYLR